MWTRSLGVLIAVCAIAIISGCGGGSGVAPDGEVGSAQGQIDAPGVPMNGFELALDGTTLPIDIAPDGSFEIPNIVPGDHVLDIIGPDGMQGGRVEFRVQAGRREVIPPVRPDLGGQIVGMVTKLEGGELTPLAGVEVVARSDMIWIMAEDGRPSVGAAEAGEPATMIYPPPDEVTYTTHTDEDGSYQMKAVVPGPYFVTVVVPGLTTGEAFVFVGPGRTAVADFTLEPAIEPGVGKIEGTVMGVDAAGSETPIEGAIVEVFIDDHWRPPAFHGPIPMPPDLDLPGPRPPAATWAGDEPAGIVPPGIIWRVFTTLTDAEGKYSLNVPSGRCSVSAWAWGYEFQSRRSTVQPGETTTEDFKLREIEDPRPPPPGPVPWSDE